VEQIQDPLCMRLALRLALLAVPGAATSAQAQQPRRGGACTGPSALVLQPFAITPEGAFYSYRASVHNAGARTRNFSYTLPVNGMQPPPGAIYSFNIQPRQTVVIVLGVSLNRIPDEALQRAMRLTCHS
jgi:hypothetical protein